VASSKRTSLTASLTRVTGFFNASRPRGRVEDADLGHGAVDNESICINGGAVDMPTAGKCAVFPGARYLETIHLVV